jgi:tetratricopeptide (TPR) repeat protein
MAGVVDTAQNELDAGLASVPHDIEGAVVHLSAAIRGFTEAGEACRAAIACVQLGNVFATFMGNRTAARAWFSRAERLVGDLAPCIEQGWVAVAALGCEVEDPEVLLERSSLALDRARQFGDTRLEIKALADAGLAHVEAGRIDEGMALLDEAMALVMAHPADVPDASVVLGQSVCSFFTACYFSTDFERAAAWADPLRRVGLLGSAPGTPVFLSSHCDSVQATLLCEVGRWGDAETVLQRAIAQFEAIMPAPDWHATIALADLRVRQGRLAEAEALLLGKDASPQALLPSARLHLARGAFELAAAAARRGLRTMKDDRLRAVELLAVLADASLGAGDVDAALRAAEQLDERTSALGLPIVRARAMATRARVLAATGDVAAAISALEPAVDGLASTTAPWLHARLLIELATLREQAHDHPGAIVEAKAAAAIIADLDVTLSPSERDILQRLLADGPAARAAVDAVLRRDGKWWSATHGGTTVRVPDTKGVRYLAALIARPGAERHAFDLVDTVEGVGEIDRRDIGDAGEVVDSRARSAYRRKVESLRAEIDEAFEIGAVERAEALQAELDEVVRQLAQAFGLGGAARTASSAAEKARLNVTRAVRAATAKLAEALPHAGAALDRAVRTGRYCAYQPSEGDIRWIVQS